MALNAGYFKGGRTTVDEVESDVELQGIRFGGTLVLPLNRYQSVKLYSISGYNARREHDFKPSASRGNTAGAAGTEPLQRVGCRRNLAPRARASLDARFADSTQAVHWTLVLFTIANVCGK